MALKKIFDAFQNATDAQVGGGSWDHVMYACMGVTHCIVDDVTRMFCGVFAMCFRVKLETRD